MVPRPVLNNDIVYVSSGLNSPVLYAFKLVVWVILQKAIWHGRLENQYQEIHQWL